MGSVGGGDRCVHTQPVDAIGPSSAAAERVISATPDEKNWMMRVISMAENSLPSHDEVFVYRDGG